MACAAIGRWWSAAAPSSEGVLSTAQMRLTGPASGRCALSVGEVTATRDALSLRGGKRRREERYVFLFEGTLIGALFTFASRPFYSTYALAPRLTGLSAVDDQQLAGLIMWIPSGIVYAFAALWLVWTALQEADVAGVEPQSPMVA